MAETTTEQVITCTRCDGSGFINRDEPGETECPVCDGDPKITMEYVAELARQVAFFRKDRDRERKAVDIVRGVLRQAVEAMELAIPGYICHGEAALSRLERMKRAVENAKVLL